jgi:hypothetical protein
MMEVVCSEMLVLEYQAVQHCKPEDLSMDDNCTEIMRETLVDEERVKQMN